MGFLKKNALLIFFGSWLLLNLVQAGATELFDDEAYYWVYSKFLDWGYYDHPPMIALLIKAGFGLFHNEFGVRLFIALLSTATLVIVYDLLPVKNKPLFFSIVASLAVLQIGGIIAVPDIPLSFFVAVFFWCYRRFLTKNSFNSAVLLGFSIALMLYSKYHGVLIVIFTFLSNPRLAGQIKAWVAVVFAILLFTPHLYWQYTHGFPSVQYHLFERNAPSYRFSFTIEYIIGQILLAGPFMGWLLLWQSFRYRATDLFEKALKFSLAGFYLFFLASTLKGRVEANWTVPALIPLMILSHQALLRKERWTGILWKSVPFTLLLVMLARIYMMLPILPLKGVPKDEFHQNRRWAADIRAKTGNLPVVFISTYQKASKYWFYSGIPSFSLNTPDYRRSNYNFWPVERELQGQPVYIVSAPDSAYFTQAIPNPFGIWGVHRADSFYSHSDIRISGGKKLVVTGGQLQPASISMATGKDANPPACPLLLAVFSGDDLKGYFPLRYSPSSPASGKISGFVDLPPGKYRAVYAIPSVVPGMPSLNSGSFVLAVN